MLRFTLALIVVCLLVQPGNSQPPDTEQVVFFTADQVEIAGTFYPGSRGSRSPSVLLLHRIGGSRQDDGWTKLAATLQKKGFAVLAFDFRGHGESITVESDFWLQPVNRGMKNASQTQKISLQDFTRLAHHATLVNDIAAARHFLNLKSREGACDSSTIIVIGAESGATLGALWIASEWQRWRTVKDQVGKLVRQGHEGHDIGCAIWLGISPTLHGRQTVPVDNWLGTPVRERVPMGLLYARRNTSSADFANKLLDRMKSGGKEPMHRLTAARALDGTDRTGSELLAIDSLDVEELILNYVTKVLEERKKVVRTRADTQSPPAFIHVESFGIR